MSSVGPSVDELLAKLKPKKVTKVLLLGNSGVGKSMLLNVLQSAHEFKSEFNLSRVTTKMEVAVLGEEGGDAYLLYNIPGLLDPNQQIAQENAAEVEKAIRDRATMPTIAFFVLTVEGGRLRAEDVQAWRSITDFVPDLSSTTLMFIVNKVPFDEFDTKKKLIVFETELRSVLKTLCGDPFETLMLPFVPKKERGDFGSVAIAGVRDSLVSAMCKLQGKALRVSEGARLRLRMDKLQGELASTKTQLEETRQDFERRAPDNDAKLQALLAKPTPSRGVDWEAVSMFFLELVKIGLEAYMSSKKPQISGARLQYIKP